MNRKVQIAITLMILNCCTFQYSSSQSTEEAKIFSHFIDRMAVPFPLPSMPTEFELQKAIEETDWDSIKKVPTTLIVDTLLFETDKDFDLPPDLNHFQFLVDNINGLPSKPVEKEKIKSEEGHRLIFGNSLGDFHGEYPQIIFMSRIAFNEDLTVAAVYAGHSSGSLSGYLNLYILEKKGGEWQIIFKENVEVS